ncbi:MAG: hypothetical protein OXL96_03570 [Candidatus Poribacteria bacterium]|nr:hypothetical protein [Candidatus Poribacteria bacterium]
MHSEHNTNHAQHKAGKVIAIFVTVALLLNTMAPMLAHAAIYLQGAEVNANTLVQDAYVAVTYYDSNGEQKLEKGWIDAIGETAFTIRSGGLKSKKNIAYDRIVSVIMSEESTVPAKQMNEVNRFPAEKKREIERTKKEEEEARAKAEQAKREARMEQGKIEHALRKLNQKTVTVMSREIDPSNITKGWYAHVIYTSKEGAKRTITGRIVNKDATGISVKVRNRWGRTADWTIDYDDIDTLVVDKYIQDIEKYREIGAQYNARVRFNAPSISKSRMVGRLVKMKQDTLIIQQGRRFYEVPRSSISNLEISLGQHRNTDKGMLFGFVLGTAIFAATTITAEETPDSFLDEKALAELFGAIGGVSIFFISTLFGAASKSDKWVEVPPQRLNLSLAPTSTKGLRAALTFNF